MTVLFVVFTILFFLGIDWLNQKYFVKKNTVQEIYFNPSIGFSMADGGEKMQQKHLGYQA